MKIKPLGEEFSTRKDRQRLETALSITKVVKTEECKF
jgi:hypothetical protein